MEAAVAAGLVRDGGEEQLSDELIGLVVAAVRPARPHGHGAPWAELEAQADQVTEWVGQDLTVVKIAELLARRGVAVPYRTLHRFCGERAGYRGRAGRDTMRVNDGEPGQECQVDFARMGLLYAARTSLCPNATPRGEHGGAAVVVFALEGVTRYLKKLVGGDTDNSCPHRANATNLGGYLSSDDHPRGEDT